MFLYYADLHNKVIDSKEIYFEQKEIADKSDFRIEEAMLAFERGEIDIDRVQ